MTRAGRRASLLCAGALLCGLAFIQVGPAQRPRADARTASIEQRQAMMDRVGKLMKVLVGSSRNGFDDLGTARRSAAAIENMARRLPRLWPAGTAIGTGRSAAKPEVWAQHARFRNEMATFASAAAGVNGALARGDRSAALQQVDRLGKSCKSCHDGFKGRKP